MHVHTIYQPAESYTEKKAMRQFQLKLKKSCERVGTNAREQSGHNTQQQLRKDKRNRFPKIPVIRVLFFKKFHDFPIR